MALLDYLLDFIQQMEAINELLTGNDWWRVQY